MQLVLSESFPCVCLLTTALSPARLAQTLMLMLTPPEAEMDGTVRVGSVKTVIVMRASVVVTYVNSRQ